MAKFAFAVFLLFNTVTLSFACDLSDDIRKGYELDSIVVPYCIDEDLCKDKREIFLSDIICAFSDYYHAPIEEPYGYRNKEMADALNKNFVGIEYYGGGVDGITYCENIRGKCIFKRGFYCESEYVRENEVPILDELGGYGGYRYKSVCASFWYEVNGKDIEWNNIDLMKKDKFYMFLIDSIPKDRRKVSPFWNLENHVEKTEHGFRLINKKTDEYGRD